MAGTKSRKLEIYDIDLHIDGKSPKNYSDAFEQVSKLDPSKRILGIHDEFIALVSHRSFEGRWESIAVLGDLSTRPHILNLASGTERKLDLENDEAVIHRAHVVFAPNLRTAIVEYNHFGPRVGKIAQLFEELLGRVYRTENVSFVMVGRARLSFVGAINELESIKNASMRITRPNPGWEDDADALSDFAGRSGAGSLLVEGAAGRGGGLDKGSGIVKFIKEAARRSYSRLKSARVVGYRPGESQPAAISLQNHIEAKRVPASVADDGEIISEQLFAHMREYAEWASEVRQ